MTSEIMVEWFKSVDREMVVVGRRLLLFLDNVPSHPSHVKLQKSQARAQKCFFFSSKHDTDVAIHGLGNNSAL